MTIADGFYFQMGKMLAGVPVLVIYFILFILVPIILLFITHFANSIRLAPVAQWLISF